MYALDLKCRNCNSHLVRAYSLERRRANIGYAFDVRTAVLLAAQRIAASEAWGTERPKKATKIGVTASAVAI